MGRQVVLRVFGWVTSMGDLEARAAALVGATGVDSPPLEGGSGRRLTSWAAEKGADSSILELLPSAPVKACLAGQCDH